MSARATRVVPAVRDEPPHHDRLAGRQQMIRALGPQPVARRERAVEVARVKRRDRGQLMDDHVGLSLSDRLGHLHGIERVGHHRLGAQVPQLSSLGLRPGHPDHAVARFQQSRHQLPAHRAGGACHEDSHFGSCRRGCLPLMTRQP
jgi:hypothetical protein